MVDPEAEGDHIDEKVEEVAINILKTRFRWFDGGSTGRSKGVGTFRQMITVALVCLLLAIKKIGR